MNFEAAEADRNVVLLETPEQSARLAHVVGGKPDLGQRRGEAVALPGASGNATSAPGRRGITGCPLPVGGQPSHLSR